jgi:excisionase family DNA binding protein
MTTISALLHEQPPYLTVSEVATFLRVHPETILRYIRRGELEAIKQNRRYLIRLDTLLKSLEAKTCHILPKNNHGSSNAAVVGRSNTGRTTAVDALRLERQTDKSLARSSRILKDGSSSDSNSP